MEKIDSRTKVGQYNILLAENAPQVEVDAMAEIIEEAERKGAIRGVVGLLLVLGAAYATNKYVVPKIKTEVLRLKS